jgi:hypothetical protein
VWSVENGNRFFTKRRQPTTSLGFVTSKNSEYLNYTAAKALNLALVCSQNHLIFLMNDVSNKEKLRFVGGPKYDDDDTLHVEFNGFLTVNHSVDLNL